MKTYLTEFCNIHEFPEEAKDCFLTAYDKIMTCKKASETLNKWMDTYEKDIHMDYKAALEEVQKAAEDAGVHKYTAGTLLYMCLSRHLKELYIEKCIDLKIFKDSCADLRWKIHECHKMYGIWGCFVAWWEPGFYDLTRFALGRLQFELWPFPESYEKNGFTKPEGIDRVISVHIPSCGKLDMEECHASYRQAAEFFADDFPGEEVIFYCESWMLFPHNRKLLGENSGVVKFMSEYHIFNSFQEDGELWRIFNRMYEGDPEVLAEDTSMQRAYKKWLLDGNHAGVGEGLFYRKKPQ